ncbi:MAG: GNAT family N-acetyltransferase [Phycisphaerae bacterium]|nr:GNAT family N-acetyltransferase [Phycisphaerae bacterium]
MSPVGNLAIADQVTRADLDQMEQYKRRYFGEGLIIPAAIVYRWYLLNPDTLVVVRDAAMGEVVGHLHVVPIVDTVVEAFTRGALGDDHLTAAFVREHPDIVRSYDEPGPYVAYLCSVAVHPDYANTHALRLVLNAYADILMVAAIDRSVLRGLRRLAMPWKDIGGPREYLGSMTYPVALCVREIPGCLTGSGPCGISGRGSRVRLGGLPPQLP